MLFKNIFAGRREYEIMVSSAPDRVLKLIFTTANRKKVTTCHSYLPVSPLKFMITYSKFPLSVFY